MYSSISLLLSTNTERDTNILYFGMKLPADSVYILELADLLKSEPLPKELEVTILPFDEEDDAETSSFMKEGVHLGIHAPNVPKLVREFRQVYYSSRNAAFESIDGENQNVVDKLMDCISCLLLLCPDHATAWADRRRVLLKRESCRTKQGDEFPARVLFWKAELGYMNMLFTQHSKAPNAWGHRRWVCRQILALLSLENFSSQERWQPSEDFIEWATLEIAVCSVIGEKFSKNYYAWTHRSFVIRTIANVMNSNMCTNDANVACREDMKSMLETEADCTMMWLRRHVSDHSAAHYGGEALSIWLEVGQDMNTCTRIDTCSSNSKMQWKIGILNVKLQESCALIEKFSSHEVIWTWRRILSHLFLACCNSHSSKEALSFLKREIVFAQSFSDESSARTCSIDKQETDMQQQFSLAYIVWLLKDAREYNLDLTSLMDEIDVVKERVKKMQLFLIPKGIAQIIE
mmetsp:Transcript_13392/g.20102  ORF Transcript_13392/g.20102 Transcript_13392/m.20102 type:complete len:462 (+) Transcript_13392:54-1439(+)